MLLQMMGRRDSWGAFLQHLWQNSEDTYVQLALSRLFQLKENGLEMESDYESLMRLPQVVLRAMSNTNTIIQLPDDGGRIGPSSDIASLHRSLEMLGRHFSYPDFLYPVQQKFNSSLMSSLSAVHDAMGAWALLQNQALVSGFWRKKTDDASRKFHKVKTLVLQQIILTSCAYLGSGGLSDVRFIEHLLRHEIRFRGMPGVDVTYLMCSLKTKHASMQKEIWQELVCSEQTWKRTIQKISKNITPDDYQ